MLQPYLRGCEEETGEPLFIIPPSPLDQRVLLTTLAKNRREDIQILSFLAMLALTNENYLSVGLAKGEDPPDCIVTANGIPYGVELTELTAGDTRREIAEARRLGRDMQARIEHDYREFFHLKGRIIALSIAPPRAFSPAERSAALEKISIALKTDLGCVGDGVDLSHGLPSEWTSRNGFYGSHHGVYVQVYAGGGDEKPMVTSMCQAEVRLSDCLQTLEARVNAKDRPGNDVLLLTCGLPDERGYVCPVDSCMFQFIQEHSSSLEFRPAYLKSIVLHLWNTPDWIELCSADIAVSWPPRRM
ncbi:MAG: hypothetical protein ACK55X_05090 [Synechococcaceae cyanobacterium]|jgi:hypothetical protein